MDLALMATARMIVSAIPQPRRWSAANDTKRPTSGKNRDKIKAARKQNRQRSRK